jgi:hypothetical protein
MTHAAHHDGCRNRLIPYLNNSITFLGNVDFPHHFKPSTRSPNQIFIDPTNNNEKTFLIFKEIATAERGTKLGVTGNHYQGSMKYDTKVSNLIIVPPSSH